MIGAQTPNILCLSPSINACRIEVEIFVFAAGMNE